MRLPDGVKVSANYRRRADQAVVEQVATLPPRKACARQSCLCYGSIPVRAGTTYRTVGPNLSAGRINLSADRPTRPNTDLTSLNKACTFISVPIGGIERGMDPSGALVA